jgi:hypothetical protein
MQIENLVDKINSCQFTLARFISQAEKGSQIYQSKHKCKTSFCRLQSVAIIIKKYPVMIFLIKMQTLPDFVSCDPYLFLNEMLQYLKFKNRHNNVKVIKNGNTKAFNR